MVIPQIRGRQAPEGLIHTTADGPFAPLVAKFPIVTPVLAPMNTLSECEN